MVDFTNLQFYGEPLISYALIGLTTAVLAYATSLSNVDKVAENAVDSVSDVTANPISNAFTSAENEGNEKPSPPPPENEEPPKTTGGKKHKRKTPRSKMNKKRTPRVRSRK